MVSWVIITIGLWVSWNYTNLESQSALYSILCPLLLFVFLVSFLMKLVLFLGHGNDRSGHEGHGGAFWGGSSGGDGGTC